MSFVNGQQVMELVISKEQFKDHFVSFLYAGNLVDHNHNIEKIDFNTEHMKTDDNGLIALSVKFKKDKKGGVVLHNGST